MARSSGIWLTQLPTGLKVEAELGKMQLKVFIGGVWAKFTYIYWPEPKLSFKMGGSKVRPPQKEWGKKVG